jgi:hypothetical protein
MVTASLQSNQVGASRGALGKQEVVEDETSLSLLQLRIGEEFSEPGKGGAVLDAALEWGKHNGWHHNR